MTSFVRTGHTEPDNTERGHTEPDNTEPGNTEPGQRRWHPGADLVCDVRHTLGLAPRETPEDRFEAWAWHALLDEHGAVLLTRQAEPSHLTASAIVLTPDARRTCLVLHGRLGLWVQPGGHLEDGDLTVQAAAAREVVEETGLSGQVLTAPVVLSRHRAPCRPGEVDWHLDVQFALITSAQSPTVSAESRDVAWFGVDALPAELAPGVAASVARAVRRVAGR
jgi:8-oxo-dGTP pyrophosphatase MutT (NUDIX family)